MHLHARAVRAMEGVEDPDQRASGAGGEVDDPALSGAGEDVIELRDDGLEERKAGDERLEVTCQAVAERPGKPGQVAELEEVEPGHD